LAFFWKIFLFFSDILQVIFGSCVKERVSLFFSSNEEHVSVNQMWKIEKTPYSMERLPSGQLSDTFNKFTA
jgi:hypothetical protein